MSYELDGVTFDPKHPLKYELTQMTPVITGSQSEIQYTNWVIYPAKNHEKSGYWGSTAGSMILMNFSIEIIDAKDSS